VTKKGTKKPKPTAANFDSKTASSLPIRARRTIIPATKPPSQDQGQREEDDQDRCLVQRLFGREDQRDEQDPAELAEGVILRSSTAAVRTEAAG